MNNQTNQVIEINANEVPKKTKAEYVEAMKRLYVEISSINEDIGSIKEEAKTRGMPASLMAKIAKLQADMSIDDVLNRNDEFAELVDEVRQG